MSSAILPALSLDPRGLAAREEPALIGVSGGRDSVALLHALQAAGHRRLVVCHLDHAWRAASQAEAAFVAELARAASLPLVTERADPPPAGENAARARRRELFARAAAAHGAGALYLAHHADDQAETVLHHLLRGAGAAGLAGMAPRRAHRVAGGELQILRPLLGTWREEIDRYVQAHGLRWCEDPSNGEAGPTRNRLRHLVLPEIERVLGRPVRAALWRSAELLAAEDACLEELVGEQGRGTELAAATLQSLPLALRRRVVRRWLEEQQVQEVDFSAVEKVLSLLPGTRVAKVNLPGGVHARRRAGKLFLTWPGQTPPAE